MRISRAGLNSTNHRFGIKIVTPSDRARRATERRVRNKGGKIKIPRWGIFIYGGIMRQKSCWIACGIGVIFCLVLSSFIGWLSASHIQGWYQTLNQPDFGPPSWVFGPVWTVLYIMIGIAGGLLWQQRQQYCWLWRLFLCQLFFNFAWSFCFFIGENIVLAQIDMLALWLSLLMCVVLSFRQNKGVAWLLLPYFLWVSFALSLNTALWYLN